MIKAKLPEYNVALGTLRRFLRVCVMAGIAQIWVVKLDVSEPKEALKIVLIAFVSGFLAAADKYLREQIKRV